MKISHIIEAIFDEGFTELIKERRFKLETVMPSGSLKNLNSIRPHITLAIYEDVLREDMVNKFELLEKVDFEAFKLRFESIAVFMNSGTIYTYPNASRKLMDYMDTVHEVYSEFKEKGNSYYVPSRWFPHVTICSVIERGKVKEAIDFLHNSLPPVTGVVNKVRLYEIHTSDLGAIENSKLIAEHQIRDRKNSEVAENG